jgi:hypothetical protein
LLQPLAYVSGPILLTAQVSASGPVTSREREVAGKVGEGQLVGGNKLTRNPLPAGISDRDGEWPAERRLRWVPAFHSAHSRRSH